MKSETEIIGGTAHAVVTAGGAPDARPAAKAGRSRPYFALDAWRGVASLWVVLFHVTGMIWQRDSGATATAMYRFGQYGSLGVQLFFVISGYCVVNAACASLSRPDGALRFIVARARRIYPPYWFAFALAAGVFVGFKLLVDHGLARPNIFSQQDYLHQPAAYYFGNITLLQAALRQGSLLAVSWTLCYEIAFYLIIGATLVLLRRALTPARLLCVLHGVTVAALVVLLAAPHLRWYPIDLWPQFGLGIVVYDLLQGRRGSLSTALIGGIVALTLAVCLRPDMPVGTMLTSARLTYAVCLGFAALLLIGYRWDDAAARLLPVKALAEVGLFSYSLYLVHTIAMRFANQGASVLHVKNPIVLLLWSSLFCVAAARLFYQFCELPFLSRSARSRAAAVASGTRPRRIAILMPLSDLRGGGEVMLYDLLKSGRDADVEWLVLFFRGGPLVEKLNELRIPTRVLDVGRLRDPFNYVRSVRRIVAALKSEHVDALVCWCVHTQLYGGVAGWLAGCPSIVYHLDKPDGNKILERIAYALPCRGILTLSASNFAAQQKVAPWRPGRLVYPGVDLDRFDPAKLGAPADLRRKLGLPLSGPLIGIVGRLQRWKGMHTLIAAMPDLVREFPDIHCVIVGGRHEAEPEYEEFLERQIASLRLEAKVTMAGLQQNVPEWMQAMDVVVHCSDNEPFGIVVIEAMALGKPVVAGAEGGPAEIIPSDEHGFLAPYDDPRAVAAAVSRCLNSPEEARAIGQNAKVRARQFSVESYAKNFIGSVIELLSGSAAVA